MIIWMLLDPETERIALMEREPDDTSLPRGNRGHGWLVRQGEIDEKTWGDLMAARIPPEEQDELHQRLWNGSPKR